MFHHTVLIGLGLLCAPALAQQSPDATQLDHVQTGLVSDNDGSFNYQGYLEENGQPANGMYSFRFEAFEGPTGSDILHENFFMSPVVPVVDGLFTVDVRMGGTPEEALRFWREIGDREMWLEIGVGEIEGGPYTTLGTRSRVGWSARAQYAGRAAALQFPYQDTFLNPSGGPGTLMSLSSVFGGTLLELRQVFNTSDPILDVRGATVFGFDFGFQNGAVRIDASDEPIGLIAAATDFSVVGILLSGAGNGSSAVFGQVNSGVIGSAVVGFNNESGNTGSLGTPNYAGDFSGNVRVFGDIEVDGSATRDFGVSQHAPIGPIAYGSISLSGSVTSGTANLTASYDTVNRVYSIGVTGEYLDFSICAVQITVVDSAEPRVATFNTNGATITVKIWDINSGSIAVADNFSIVIYKPDPDAFVLRGAPAGVDADKYSEQTGTTPVIGTVARPAPAPRPDPRGIGG